MVEKNRTTRVPCDVMGLPTEFVDIGLERFLFPRTVAVLGASDVEFDEKTGHFKNNTIMYRKVTTWAERTGAMVYPVNPGRAQIGQRQCYRSVVDLPEEIDLAVVLVDDAIGAMKELAQVRPHFAIVFSSGFAELGPEGARRQDQLLEIARAADIRMMGPNTNLSVFEPSREDITGPKLALVTQSGQQGRPIFQAQEMGVALTRWISTGNEADLEVADFFGYFAGQEGVATITAYVESFKDGRALVLAADRALRAGVPIVLVKVGRTDEGTSMAASHTGHLAGSDAVASAVFRQYGIIRVEDMDELLDTSILMARASAPRATGVCVYSISGGTAAHTADLASAAGLRLPTLTEETQERLREWIPSYLRVSNPVDSGGAPAADWRGQKIIETLAGDPNIGVLICVIAGSHPPMTDQIAMDLVAVAANTDATIVAVWGSPTADEAAYREILLGSPVPVFRSVRNCVHAVRAYLDYHEKRSTYVSPFANPVTRVSAAAKDARGIIEECGYRLSEHDAKRLLSLYGIPTTKEERCSSLEEAFAAAERIGYPVVLKVDSPHLLHKSELGLVRVGVADDNQLRIAWKELTDRARVAGVVEIRGLTVSELVSGGIETIVGAFPDVVFGPTLMFGLGGVFAETLNDVAFRSIPLLEVGAKAMFREIRGAPLLYGTRGRDLADVEALKNVMMSLQRMYMDLAGVIAEVDINPLVVLKEGVVALDALITIRENSVII